MFETMDAHRGTGLAAPQVGRPWRVIVADTGSERLMLVNPEIVRADGAAVADEGCLSLPNWYGPVERATDVTVKGLGLDGKPVRRRLRDLAARVVLHEIDHLDGVIFTDRLVDPEKLRFVDPALVGSAAAARVVDAMRVVFFGTPDFGVPALRRLSDRFEVALVVTRPDRPVGRGGRLTAPPVAAAARELDLEPVSATEPQPGSGSRDYFGLRTRCRRRGCLWAAAGRGAAASGATRCAQRASVATASLPRRITDSGGAGRRRRRDRRDVDPTRAGAGRRADRRGANERPSIPTRRRRTCR